MSEPKTIIGENIVVNGNLQGDEDLTVEGQIDGTINLLGTLNVSVNGRVHATVTVQKAVISGVLVGDIEATESVQITESGRVTGDIVAPRVIMAEGASFLGKIDMGDPEVGHFQPRTTSIPAPTRSIPPPIRKSVPPPIRKSVPPAATKSIPPPSTIRAAAVKKAPPSPKVRSVGKTKATRKKGS